MKFGEKLKNEKFLNFSIIILLLALNIIIKSIYLADYNIDLDEPFSIFHSQKTISELLKIFIWENNPPLFFVILHFWIKLFGIGVVSARLLPMIFSSLAVIFIYNIGNKFLNKRLAIGASLLYTFSNINLMEAHDTRVYSLLVLLTVASMYYYFSLIDSEKKNKYLTLLTIANTLLIYAHFLAFFVIILQAFYTILIPSVKKRILKEYLFSSCLLFIYYTPYLFISIIRITKTFHTGVNAPPIHYWDLYSSFLNTFGNNFITGNLFFVIIILFVLHIVLIRSKLSVYEIMISGWFFYLFLLVFLFSFKIQIFTNPKYLIFLTPGFFLTLMIACNHLIRRAKYLNVILISLCISIMLISVNINYKEFESKKAVSYIKNHQSDSTLVLIAPPWIGVVFTYHYNIEVFKDYNHYLNYLADKNIFIISAAYNIDISRLLSAKDVLLLDGWDCMKISDPNKTIIALLNEKYSAVDTINKFNCYKIYHFKTKKSNKDSIP